jgi:hypothetical protein
MLQRLINTTSFMILLALSSQSQAQTWDNGGNYCNNNQGGVVKCQCPSGWSVATAKSGNCYFGPYPGTPGCWTGNACVTCGTVNTVSLGNTACFSGQQSQSAYDNPGPACNSASQCVSAGSSGGGQAVTGTRPTSGSAMPKK